MRSLDARPEVIAHACGRPEAATGEPFVCVLGAGHQGGTARVDVRETRVVYACDCDEFERSLTEVYVTRFTGVPRKRGKAEFVRWKVRLAVEAGVLLPPRVILPPLASSASNYAKRVHTGLGLFVAVRLLTDPPGEHFTFTRTFAAEWCGLEREQANSGIKSLRALGVLVKTGTTPAGAHEANVYVIGAPA